MTVNSSVSTTGFMAADGVKKDWSFDFPIFQQGHVVVEVQSPAGVRTEFTTNLTLFKGPDSTGYVRYPVTGAALTTGNSLRIIRRVPLLQETQIGRQGAFDPELHEKAFDLAAMRDQQAAVEVDKTADQLRTEFALADNVVKLALLAAIASAGLSNENANAIPANDLTATLAGKKINIIANLFNFEIKPHNAWDFKEGRGLSTEDRDENSRIIKQAFLDSATYKRPVKLKPGAEYVHGTFVAQAPPAVYGYGATLRHEDPNQVTGIFIGTNPPNPAAPLMGIEIYDLNIDANAQSKPPVAGAGAGGFYPLVAMYNGRLVLERVKVIDPWGTALYMQNNDAYSVVPYGMLSSFDAVIRDCEVYRSADNRAIFNPANGYRGMMQADQAVVVGHKRTLLENYKCADSGRSGISVLTDDLVVRGIYGERIWCLLYAESCRRLDISGVRYTGHGFFNGDSSQVNVDSVGVWLADGAQSGVNGMGSCRDGYVHDCMFWDVNRPAGMGKFIGVKLSGRDGLYGMKNMRVEGIVGNALTGGAGGTLLQLSGQLDGVHARGIQAYGCDVAVEANVGYQTSGGVLVNSMKDCSMEVDATNCGYAFKADGTGTHTRVTAWGRKGDGAVISGTGITANF